MYGTPQYGYGAPMFGYGMQPYGYGGMRPGGLVRPKQLVGYQQRQPTTGERLARLGLSGAAKGVGQIARDATVDAMTEDVGKTAGAAAGSTVGSIVAPGVGTMVGGFGGGLAGGILDMFFEEEKKPVYQAPPPPPKPRLDMYANRFAPQGRAGFYGVQNPYGFRMG